MGSRAGNAAKRVLDTTPGPWKQWPKMSRHARAIRFIQTYCAAPKGKGFGQPLVLATIDTPYTADFSAAFVATERLRLANEGAIRTNIGQFMDKLRQANVKSSAPATTAASGGN